MQSKVVGPLGTPTARLSALPAAVDSVPDERLLRRWFHVHFA